MKGKLNIAIIQARLAWENVPENLRRFDERIEHVTGAEVIVLPEMFSSGFTMQGKEKIAPFYEETYSKLLEWASRKKALIMGSVIFRQEERFYNRLLAVFPDGKVEWYDKRHCFTMGGEDKHFTSGNKKLLIEYEGVKIAPFICYDLRFPVWSRNTEMYDMAVYVANWPAVRREAWQILLRARAIENQCYVIGVNCVGKDGNELEYSGESAIVSPKGEVLVRCEVYEDDIRQMDIDLVGLREFRKRFPVLEDRDRFIIQK